MPTMDLGGCYNNFTFMPSQQAPKNYQTPSPPWRVGTTLITDPRGPTLCLFHSCNLTLKEVIEAHNLEVLDEDAFRITARRSHIFEDTVDTLRLGFDERKRLHIIFFSEAAVDDGGPRREFFMTLLGAIANNGSLLDGPPDRRILRHNATAFQVRNEPKQDPH